MLLYLDSSSIVKLFIEESGSSDVEQAAQMADGLASSRIAFAEVSASLAGARRAHRLTEGDFPHLKSRLARHWASYFKISVTNRVVQKAGELAEKHALSGPDAIHLASAMAFRERMNEIVGFAVADQRLRSSAIAEGFTVV